LYDGSTIDKAEVCGGQGWHRGCPLPHQGEQAKLSALDLTSRRPVFTSASLHHSLTLSRYRSVLDFGWFDLLHSASPLGRSDQRNSSRIYSSHTRRSDVQRVANPPNSATPICLRFQHHKPRRGDVGSRPCYKGAWSIRLLCSAYTLFGSGVFQLPQFSLLQEPNPLQIPTRPLCRWRVGPFDRPKYGHAHRIQQGETSDVSGENNGSTSAHLSGKGEAPA